MSLGGWSEGYRFRRIRNRIEAIPSHTLESVRAIHADVVHGRSEALAGVVARLARDSGDRSLRVVDEVLRDWDGAFATDSPAPTVFVAFWDQWLRRVARARFPERVVSLVMGRLGAVAARLLAGEACGWMPGGMDVNAEATAAIRKAIAGLRDTLGPRRSQWRWGRVHQVTFGHPAAAGNALGSLLDVGPFESSGGTGTVRAAGHPGSAPFSVTSLSTYRMAVDLSDPAHGCATTAGGQSGHPADANYRTQSELWAADRYHPLLMDEKDVRADLKGDLALVPERA